jgi:hypothetical protein
MRPWSPRFQRDTEAGRKGEAVSGGDGGGEDEDIFSGEVESGSNWRLSVFPEQ